MMSLFSIFKRKPAIKPLPESGPRMTKYAHPRTNPLIKRPTLDHERRLPNGEAEIKDPQSDEVIFFRDTI